MPRSTVSRIGLATLGWVASMLNLAFVKTFVTLVETGSYNVTARSLGIAQPTVSQQIRKLESILGTVLINRSKVSCAPTPDGRMILPYARALLASAERFCAASAGNHVCIGCSGNIAAYYISADLKTFVEREKMPFGWDIRGATNPELADLLLHGEIDIAAMEWPDRRPGLNVRPWRREPLVVIVPPDHVLAGSVIISVDQLLKLELVGGERGSGTGVVLKRALGERADALRIAHNLNSTEAVKAAVRAGLGSSIVLRGTVSNELAAGQLSALTVDGVPLEKTFYVCYAAELPSESLPVRLGTFLTGAGNMESD